MKSAEQIAKEANRLISEKYLLKKEIKAWMISYILQAIKNLKAK